MDNLTVMDLLKAGGVTVVVLVICSVISLAVALDRFVYYFMKSRTKRSEFMPRVKNAVQIKDLNAALRLCETTDTPFAKVVEQGLQVWGQEETAVSNAMERGIAIETSKLQERTSINGTIGSIAVYIGLFGTVLGIIRAFHDISRNNAGGMDVAINGISEALICTAVGLVVAVPAVIFYNYFVKRIDQFLLDMELCASEILDLAKAKK